MNRRRFIYFLWPQFGRQRLRRTSKPNNFSKRHKLAVHEWRHLNFPNVGNVRLLFCCIGQCYFRCGSQAFRYVSSSNGRLQSELLIRPELIQWQLRAITNMQFELHFSRSNNLKANHPTLDKHLSTGRKPASTHAVRKVRAQCR